MRSIQPGIMVQGLSQYEAHIYKENMYRLQWFKIFFKSVSQVGQLSCLKDFT